MQEPPHASLINELGGGTAIAIALWGSVGPDGKHREAVYKWKQNGIPWRWRPAVERLAKAKSLLLPPGFLLSTHDDQPSEVVG